MTRGEIDQLRNYLIKDEYTNKLLEQYQQDPNSLSEKQRGIIEQEVMKVARSYNVSPDVFFKIDLNNSIRRNDRDIKAYIGFNDSWNTRITESTYEGLGYASGVVMPSSVVLSSLPKVGAVVREYPIISEKLSNAALSIGATYASNRYNGKETSLSDLAWSGGTGFITGGQSIPLTIGVNSASSGLQAYIDGNDPAYAVGASAITTSAGSILGKAVEKGGYRLMVGNVARNKSYYEPQYRTPEAMNQLNEQYKYIPAKIGFIVDGGFSEFINNKLQINQEDIKKTLGGNND